MWFCDISDHLQVWRAHHNEANGLALGDEGRKSMGKVIFVVHQRWPTGRSSWRCYGDDGRYKPLTSAVSLDVEPSAICRPLR